MNAPHAGGLLPKEGLSDNGGAPGENEVAGMIEAERELLNELRRHARQTLGPRATEAQVEARAQAAYHGPVSVHNRPETEAEKAERLREVEATIAMMKRWNL